MNLKSLILPKSDRPAKPIDYDKANGVSFDLIYLPRNEMQQIVSRHTKIKFNPKTHQKDEEVDGEGLRNEVIDLTVKGWKGVSYKWVNNLIPLDIKTIDDINAELPFTTENRNVLFTQAYGLDSWLLDTVKDAAYFNEKKEAETKN